MLHVGEVLQSRYEIVKTVGKGGMSTVYQARDLVTGKLLAIKDVERSGKEQDQVVKQSLAAEGRMLMQLDNPHLPKIYDIIESQDSFMLVMDFVQGKSLDKVISRTGAQSMDRVLDWGMQICEVFHYLHNQPVPIIYRDMKPANVMLQPDGQIMMIDFGTARTQKVGVEMQADTICIGTAGFAAPEQFGGSGQSTARTDIFCLGATLYNLVTGHSPYERPVGILPLEYWNPALANTPIAEIIYKCTRNDPLERYQTAWDLREDLRLASVGGFKDRRGPLSGRLRGNEWQKLDVQGRGMIAEGLSGLLHRTKTEPADPAQKKPETKPQTPSEREKTVRGSQWQTLQTSCGGPGESYPMAEQPEEEKNQLLSRLTLIALLVATIFVVFTLVLILLKQIAAAIVFLIIALIAAGCGAVGAVLSHKFS